MRHALQRGRMDTVVGLLLVLCIGWALAACGQTEGASTQSNTTAQTESAAATTAASQGTPTRIPTRASQGIIAGKVAAGPTCPVERAEDPCPPRPVAGGQVLVRSEAGTLLTTATTDAQGRFQVALAPGVYLLTVSRGPEPGVLGMHQTARVQATVRQGEVTHVDIMLDTGIR